MYVSLQSDLLQLSRKKETIKVNAKNKIVFFIFKKCTDANILMLLYTGHYLAKKSL